MTRIHKKDRNSWRVLRVCLGFLCMLRGPPKDKIPIWMVRESKWVFTNSIDDKIGPI